jgi:hypothetical protein
MMTSNQATSAVVSSPGAWRVWAALPRPALFATLGIGALIAWLLPFDTTLMAITGDSAVSRALLVMVLVLVGGFCADRAGLRLEGHGVAYPFLLGVGAAILVAVYVIVLDCLLFRSLLPSHYVAIFEQPLGERLAYFMLRAFNENIIYRLFLFASLLFCATRYYGPRPVPWIIVVALMVASQMVNIWLNVVSVGVTPTATVLLYDLLRYVAPGAFWAFLFWRNGFLVAEVASVGCHLFLQPAMGVLL